MQHDFNITNADANSGVNIRAAINAALQALATNNSGATEPASPYAYMWWPDTTAGLLKQRDAANAAWITRGKLADAYWGLAALATSNEFNASQHLDGDALLWRFRDTGASGKEWGVRSDGGNLEICENTGTEGTPTWTVRKTFTSGAVDSGAVDLVDNLKLSVNAAVNKLDILTKSGGAVPDATNYLTTSIPDGTGSTARTRAAAYLLGTSQLILADATAYWGAVSGADKIKLHPYDIYDANGGIVHALSRYSGFTNVPTTTTVGDDDYFLLEAGSTYTRAATDFCVCTGHVWANYNTANTPDWTIYKASDSAELAPMVAWNPPNDYGKTKNLATTLNQESQIAEYSAVSHMVKQPGGYDISGYASVWAEVANLEGRIWLKIGSATYANAVYVAYKNIYYQLLQGPLAIPPIRVYLNAGDTIHLGVFCDGGSATRTINGDDSYVGATGLTFKRVS